MKIVLSKAAQRSLVRSNKSKLIAEKIQAFADDPGSLDQKVTRLAGRPHSRLRVQNRRVVFRIENATLFVDEIGPRGSVYEDSDDGAIS